MSREAQVNCSLSIRKGYLNWQSQNLNFQADVDGTFGPTPGAFLASVAGTDVDLSALETYGLAELRNLDTTNFVDYGIWDGASFYPLGRLLAGEGTVLRLSPNLGQEYTTGTGTSGAAINTLRFKADTAACNVSVCAFEA